MKQVDITPKTILAPAASKVMIDDFLMPLLHQLTEDARRISPHYETLWQDIQNLYTAGGKRLRSYMTLLTYEAFSHTPAEAILPAAAAQELLHVAMLIHDDIIDRDTIRYGVKNVMRQYLDHYEELIENEQDRQHYASSAAILAGDLLLTQSFILVAETNVDAVLIHKTQQLLAHATFTVIGGELLDTEAAFRGADSADPLVIAQQKTANYSFVTPFLVGATLAGVGSVQLAILEQLGEQLGIAYQLRDDVLGVFGDQAATGKSIDGDIKEGKRTLLIEKFRSLGSETQQNEFAIVFGKHDADGESIARAKALLIESGAKAAVEDLIDSYRDHCFILVDSLEIDQSHREAFNQLIALCVKRDK
ncbi:MAG TPA: polyprenyl synthetase family protein [Candidatus Microsaccharimonas sp.]|jgi:geranylgeranyl diphosphate synthase type II